MLVELPLAQNCVCGSNSWLHFRFLAAERRPRFQNCFSCRSDESRKGLPVIVHGRCKVSNARAIVISKRDATSCSTDSLDTMKSSHEVLYLSRYYAVRE
jgi:hypothetical protein